MADTVQLEIVSPQGLILDGTAEKVQIPGKSGYLGILPKHAALITELAAGDILYAVNGVAKSVRVNGGIAEILPNRVTIVAEVNESTERALQSR